MSETDLYDHQVPLTNFTIELPIIDLFNPDLGVGFRLNLDERPELGVFNFQFSFPSKWYPKLQEYNRSIHEIEL